MSAGTTTWGMSCGVASRNQQTRTNACQIENQSSLHDASFRQRESRCDVPLSHSRDYPLPQPILSVNRLTVTLRNRHFRRPEPPAFALSFNPQLYSRYLTRARPLFVSGWAEAGTYGEMVFICAAESAPKSSANQLRIGET